MKATVMTEFGGPEVFSVRNIPQPEPKTGEVLVRVSATAVNLIDCRHRQFGFLNGMKLPAVVGCEVSGVIEATGDGVHHFAVGDEVFYLTTVAQGQGSYAEYHVTKETTLVKKPNSLTHVEAVGLPMNGSILWEALIVEAGLSDGETLLILDGIDSLGTTAIQVAKSAAPSANVIVLCGKHQRDIAEGLGAHVVIDNKTNHIHQEIMKATGGAGIDVLLDTVGGLNISKHAAHMKHHGRMVGLWDMQGDLAEASEKGITTKLIKHQADQSKLEMLCGLIDHHKLKPVVDTVMPLSQVGVAQQRLERGIGCGKIILIPN